MNLTYTLKSLGKKRACLEKQVISLPIQSTITAKELLTEVVVLQVKAFSDRIDNANLLTYLSEEHVLQAQNTGQVKFGESYNAQKPKIEESIAVVLQGFEDGLIAFFINDLQIEKLDQIIRLKEKDNLTFVRLTFLTGSFF